MSKTITKKFENVSLKVDFTSLNSNTAMSNITANENIATSFAKIAHWYSKTNGFTSTTVNKVSTTSDGIVSQLPSSTGGFLKNTGTAGGTWATINISDLPRDSNSERVLTTHGDCYMKGVFEPLSDGDGTVISINDTTSGKAQLGSSNYRWSRIYGVNLYATKLNDVTIPDNPVFTDHIATATTTGAGAGKAVTSISDDGAGNITAATGSFLPSTTTYAGSDAVGGSASKAKSLNVYDFTSVSNNIIDTANFEVGAMVNSTTHNDSFAIKFNDADEAITSSAMSALIIDNDRQDLTLVTYKNDGTQIFQKTFLSEFVSSRYNIPSSTYTGTLASASLGANRTWTFPDKSGTVAMIDDVPSTSDFIPTSGSTTITGSLILSTSNGANLGSSSKLWGNLYATNVNVGNLYKAAGTAGGIINCYSNIYPDANDYRSLGTDNFCWNEVAGTYVYIKYLHNVSGQTKIRVRTDLEPYTDSYYNLGTSSKYWDHLYVNDITYWNSSETITVTPYTTNICTITAQNIKYIPMFNLVIGTIEFKLGADLTAGSDGKTATKMMKFSSYQTKYKPVTVKTDGTGNLNCIVGSAAVSGVPNTLVLVHVVANTTEIRIEIKPNSGETIASGKTLRVSFSYFSA